MKMIALYIQSFNQFWTHPEEIKTRQQSTFRKTKIEPRQEAVTRSNQAVMTQYIQPTRQRYYLERRTFL
jgi:hypothetical protein